MKKVLVIGPSGAGKTYLTDELGRFGLNTVDADTLEKLHSWYDGKGNKVEFPEDAGKEFLDNHSFLWDREFLVGYLKENPNVYLFGASGNVFDMLGLFDKVYYLNTTAKVIDERLQYESRENPMGKTDYQRRNAIKYAKELRAKANKLGLEFVDGTLTPKEIYEQIK